MHIGLGWWQKQKYWTWKGLHMSELSRILSELGLQHLQNGFDQNAITDDLLSELSDADLKEIGVLSLGERKRLLKAFRQGATPPATAEVITEPPPVVPPAFAAEPVTNRSSAGGNEQELLNVTVNGVPVRITTHRAIFNSQTLALANIGSVQAFSEPPQDPRPGLWIAAVVFGGIGLASFNADCTVLGFILGGIGALCAMAALGSEVTQVHHCQIAVAGTNQNVLSSTDIDEIVAVVESLNEAIMTRQL